MQNHPFRLVLFQDESKAGTSLDHFGQDKGESCAYTGRS